MAPKVAFSSKNKFLKMAPNVGNKKKDSQINVSRYNHTM